MTDWACAWPRRLSGAGGYLHFQKYLGAETANDDGDRHGLFQHLVFLEMQIAAGAGQARGHAHAQSVIRLQPGTVGAHVLDTAFGILGDAQSRCEIRGGVEARRRDGDRELAQAFLGKVAPVCTISWHGAWSITTGGMGLAMARTHVLPISSTATPRPAA